MNNKPGEGERRAVGGYRPQYLMGAKMILQALKQRDLEWIRVADPDAGRVDDLQIGTTARVDAYQVKWKQYGGATTLNDLISGTDKEPSLIAQLADGWKRLQEIYAERRVVVHLITNTFPSPSSGAQMPKIASRPNPYHLAAFIQQAWIPAQHIGSIKSGNWNAVWQSIQQASGLTHDEFSRFVQNCSLDFQAIVSDADADADVERIAALLFKIAAEPERRVEISEGELLRDLGWQNRYSYRNVHEFSAPQFLYRPIQKTVNVIETALDHLPSGYIGVFGSPGSGKSTLLTQTLRALPIRLIRYYAYVPDAQDLSILRGESVNFLQDVTLRLGEAGFCRVNRPDPSDRSALLSLLHQQLQELGDDYQRTKTKTVILVDGLDHIAREQHPERSLLHDLPLPESLPVGVYIVIGSQPNGLENLPVRVDQSLKQQERQIEIEYLTPKDVYLVAEATIPDLNQDEHQQIFDLAGGHPLALIYLLKQLLQIQQPQTRTQLLEETIPYEGDIDEQYWTHWRRIENDENLTHTLGLLARIRGAIPFQWVAQWADRSTLRRLQQLFLTTYFQKEGENSWVFFHNSFRLFLEERTSEPLIGQTREQQNQEHHHTLAKHYQSSLAPYRWETLYHFYKAGDYTAVVAIANQTWFREQAESLRPYDAIWTDIRLAFKAAGECQDVFALIELTLAGAAVDQRINDLDEIPELLLKAGKLNEVVEQLRDGNRLRKPNHAEQALRLSVQLYEVGLLNEARRIFELAEPLELLSGRSIANDQLHARNSENLLQAWVQSALVFRGCEEVVRIIQRLRVVPDRAIDREASNTELSESLQSWLLHQGVLVCCERQDSQSWQILYDALLESADRKIQFLSLLRSAQVAYSESEAEFASVLLQRILGAFQPEDLDTLIEPEKIAEVRIEIAELILGITKDKLLARQWLENLAPVPLQDRNSDSRRVALYELQFRYGRLHYLVGQGREPEALRDEAEIHTNFSSYVKEDQKQSYRIHALAMFHLARLRAWGDSGFQLQSSLFRREVRWILDIIGPRHTDWVKPSDLEIRSSRSWMLDCVIEIAALHGAAVVEELMRELESRWSDFEEGASWVINLQRDAVIALNRSGASLSWSTAQLRRIESIMLRNLDPQERAEACKAQAEAWLMLGEKDAAIAVMQRMMRVARGISYEKDYQLSVWVDWLEQVNQLELDRAEERFVLMLKRTLSIHGNASGVYEAAEKLIGVMFKQSPRRAVRLLKGLLELDVVGYQGSLVYLLKKALEEDDPPVIEILYTVVNLILPFVTNDNSDLVELLVVKIANLSGSDDALEVATYLVKRIRVDMLSNCRPTWHRAIAAGLQAIGCAPESAGLQLTETVEPSRDSSQIDRRLPLKNGESLEPEEVLNRTNSIGDFQALIAEQQEKGNYFRWERVVEHLSHYLMTSAEVEKLEQVVKSFFSADYFKRNQLAPMLVALSKRLWKLGHFTSAWRLAEQALNATDSSAWDFYFDGGAKYEVLEHLISMDAEKGRKIAIKLYADDASQGHIPSYRVMIHLDRVIRLLMGEIPVIRIWKILEEYLEELFGGVLINPELPSKLVTIAQFDAAEEDTSSRAIADLLSLHLDHPSYPVAQGAVRSCLFGLLQGSPTITDALKEALTRTEQSAERALMVLDALSLENSQSVAAFDEILAQLELSTNLLIRLIATWVRAQYTEEGVHLQSIEREIPAIYSFDLPSLSMHRTEEAVARRSDTAVWMQDPARKLRPLDIEARAIARLAGVSESNVYYQAIEYFHQLKKRRSWLTEENGLDQERVSRFLDGIGLRHTFQKPHIAIARQALAHVCADLYDDGYFASETVQPLAHILIYYDPAFIRYQPTQRSPYIAPMGGIIVDHSSFAQLPKNWLETAEDSLPLLNMRTLDGRIILAEWTQLKRLDDKSPEEERISVIRAINPEHLWDGLDVESGRRPFPRFIQSQVDEYLSLNAAPNHLTISGDGYGFDTPGTFWMALNPSVARALGWCPLDAGWFSWANQAGDLVVESLWWNDGPSHQHSEYLHCEVGSGWLVLVTERGFEEIKQWAGKISRGGVITRRLGQHARDGEGNAIGVLAL